MSKVANIMKTFFSFILIDDIIVFKYNINAFSILSILFCLFLVILALDLVRDNGVDLLDSG